MRNARTGRIWSRPRPDGPCLKWKRHMSDAHSISIVNLRQRWRAGQPWVLDIPAFNMGAHEQVFLAGPSGSGKSTLLAVLCGVIGAAVEGPGGHVQVLGHAMHSLPATTRDQLRADQMGVIFQLFNLLPYLSALDNVLLAGQFASARRARAAARSGSLRQEAERLLAELHLPAALWARRARELSVGQQQRVAAARALFGGPRIVFADEPTSALDADSRNSFLELLQSECRATRAALLFVSHERALAERFDRSVELGQINRAANEDPHAAMSDVGTSTRESAHGIGRTQMPP